MSPESLRDLLTEEAERAPHVVAPTDTWRRGRRRRTAKVAGGAFLAVVAVVAGVAVAPSLVDRMGSLDPAGSSPSPGLPDHLHAPPERMSDIDQEFGGWMREEVLQDLAIGPAAAAWVTPGGLPVVVDAETGEHHLLDLPDVISANAQARAFYGPDWQPLALSPDGRQLAYGFATIRKDVRLTGVRVVDLVTGEAAWRQPLSAEAGIAIRGLAWSRSGDWVGWTGSQPREWTPSSIGGTTAVGGVVDADSAGLVLSSDAAGTLAVATGDDGVAYVLDQGHVRTTQTCEPAFEGGTLICSTPTRRWAAAIDLAPGAALSPDGSTLALSTYSGYDLTTLPVAALFQGIGPRLSPPVPDIGAEGAPDDRGWSTSSLGWVDDEHVLVLRDPNDGSASTLAIVPVDAESGPSIDVGVVDSAVGVPSIAIDLVTLDRPTVERPEPDWPWSEERWVATIAAGSAVVLVLLLVGIVLLRRRAR